MWWTVRTTTADRPGALARIAGACGERGVNVLGLQIHPALGEVRDELVLETPAGWVATDLADLIGAAGRLAVEVEPRPDQSIVDETVRWLRAAHRVLAAPERRAAVVAGLVPGAPSGIEQARLDALGAVLDAAAEPPPEDDLEVDVEVAGSVVRARAGSTVVATGRLAEGPEPEVPQLTVVVRAAWRRRGIGRAVLAQTLGLALATGAHEVVLVAPAADEGTLPLLDALGLRGRMRLHGGDLHVRLAVPQRHRLEGPAMRSR
ncbi:hypothetical protein GCM10011519_15200 [Marmoricola endophyticus]|uniref:GNAT family N-acetyltransferase n=1 Tax=Marmoricola endophyticus TaxID=2040280 RepID=A0A917F192_9ACTN|nr:GNAT family N-acetyltransferase [Marmoricola endophyticus]GGF42314.1 hypothetical protein GCM10011519_15200 [Marmoricola endophyticus]